MKCSEFEKRIYLYRELNALERQQTDDHLSLCKSCNELATQLFEQQEVFRKIGAEKFVVKEPQRLTQKIMNSIEKQEKRVSLPAAIASFLDSLFVRYAFSILSVLLLLFFYSEQQDTTSIEPVAKAEIKQGSILSTSSFLKQHLENRQQRATTLSLSRYSYAKSERLGKNL